MVVPLQVTQWVDKIYKRPRVDPEWLNDCYEWLITEGGHNPGTNLQALLEAVEHQIMESNFGDSMLPGTGLPTHVAVPTTTTVLEGLHVLVEVVSITEVANSAFNLNQTHNAREERMKAGDVDDGEGEGDIEVEGEGPMPKYPRGMLKLQLYDGTITLPAIEYRSLPGLSLENTPLGFKMILKDLTIRRGIAWLEPESIILMGHKTGDRDECRQSEFVRGLRTRMGLLELEIAPESRVPLVHVPNNEPQWRNQHNLSESRPPLREISPPPSPPSAHHINDDEDLEPRRRRVPGRVPDVLTLASSVASPPQSNIQKINRSSHFTSIETNAAELVDLVVSPPRRTAKPLFVQTKPSPFHDENVEPLKLSEKGKEKEQESDWSSDGFGDESMELDPDFLERLDRVEKEAYGHAEKVPPASFTESSRADSSALSGRSQTFVVVQSQISEPVIDVITIEDDEEEGDKENSPVPTRHVRRRTEDVSGEVISPEPATSQRTREPGRPVILARTPSDVIELSDSE
ncbi:hypothetical protein BDZ94DRAFT_1275214 [Collybia nuda]|uniref:RecQ-mediated genome instability protein 1 n=1 Tax=Collybia nuda TaxID=64659 RepID=A0A9P5XVS2_9AGAR|nr:hypothetical protein BDZ94DRAFT_1275214 [Collybia nuda]